MKKIFIASIILLIIALVSFLVYNFFFKETPGGADTDPNGALPSSPADISGNGSGSKNPSSSNAPQARGSLRALSQEKVMAAAIHEDGKTVKYYSKENGNVWKSGFEGENLQRISSVTIGGLVKVLWSPDKEKVISFLADGSVLKKYLFNYKTNQSSPLNDGIKSIAWSPNGKNIAYQYTDASTGLSNISVADPDGGNWRNVFKTRIDDLMVEWPSDQKISIRSRVSGLAQGLVYTINPQTGDFQKIISDQFGLSIKWSPKTDKILASLTDSNGRNPKIILFNENGTQSKDLNLKGIVDKCAWSKDNLTIFCALPYSEFSNYDVWPDDYYKGTIIVNDAIYKINLETNEKTMLAGSLEQIGIDAQDMFLSPKEDYLFFTNRKNGLLYGLKL